METVKSLPGQAAAGARAHGTKVEIIHLRELTLAPCTACDACQNATESDCIIDDDITSLLPRIRQADAIVISGPVYWFTFAAQTKLFIDRVFYALNGPEGHALKGKPLGLLMTYGDTDPYTSGAVNALRSFQDICRYIGAQWPALCMGVLPRRATSKRNRLYSNKPMSWEGQSLLIRILHFPPCNPHEWLQGHREQKSVNGP